MLCSIQHPLRWVENWKRDVLETSKWVGQFKQSQSRNFGRWLWGFVGEYWVDIFQGKRDVCLSSLDRCGWYIKSLLSDRCLFSLPISIAMPVSGVPAGVNMICVKCFDPLTQAVFHCLECRDFDYDLCVNCIVTGDHAYHSMIRTTDMDLVCFICVFLSL